MEMISPFDSEGFYGDVTRVDDFFSPRRVYRALIRDRETMTGDATRALSISETAIRLYRLRRTSKRGTLVGGRVIRIVRDFVEVERKQTW